MDQSKEKEHVVGGMKADKISAPKVREQMVANRTDGRRRRLACLRTSSRRRIEVIEHRSSVYTDVAVTVDRLAQCEGVMVATSSRRIRPLGTTAHAALIRREKNETISRKPQVHPGVSMVGEQGLEPRTSRM